MKSLHHETTSSTPRSAALRSSLIGWTASALLCGAGLVTACGDDDSPSNGAGAGGGGSGGSAGSAGTGGGAGSAGDAGSAGAGGGAGSGGQNTGGTTGTIQVLSSDAALLGPTTAAVRGENVFVVNGQLAALFGGPPPTLPFNVVSIPLTGGAIEDTINLSGDTFFPEGIAAAADGTLYVGSLSLGTVVRVPASSTTPDAAPFVADTVTTRGVVGLTVDEARDLLWLCDSAGGLGAELVGVSLDDGSEVVRHAMPDPGAPATPDAGADAGADAGVNADAGDAAAPAPITSFCNDVIVDGSGNVLATDSSGRIFRVPAANVMTANSAEVWLEAPALAPPLPGGFGVNGLDRVGGQLIVANGGLFAIDPANPSANIRPITLTLNGAVATLCGPDGLEAVPNSNTDIIVVENGFCPSGVDRVIRVTLDLGE